MRLPKPAIKSNAIRFDELEKLADRKEKANLYSTHVSIIKADPIVDKLREYEELELRVHQLCEATWGKDPLWHNEETCPDCKYSIGVDDDEITVWDFVNSKERTFARRDLDDPDFNIAEIFVSPELNRTLTSVQEGGYPSLGNYQCWDWPAINWLHAQLTSQLEFVDEGNMPDGVPKEKCIDIQPTMFGYSIQLDESDLIYNITHEEVLDEHFSPEWIIDHILMA